jgi:hypothetical protein
MIEGRAEMKKVFISYSRDSSEHCGRVLSLSNQLRKDGLNCILDQYEQAPPQGWPKWMDQHLSNSDFVLIICTKSYYKRVMGEEEQGKGKNEKWESTLTYSHIYDNDSLNKRFIPVLFSEEDSDYIPIPLKGSTYYNLNDATGYEKFYRRLTGQPLVKPPEIGKILDLDSKEPASLFSETTPGRTNMKSQPEQYSDISITTAPSEQQKKKGKRSKIKTAGIASIIFTAVLAIITQISPNIFNLISSTPAPRFSVEKAIINSDLPIIIIPINNSAKKGQPLDVRWDGTLFNQAGKFVGDAKSFKWEFSLKEHVNDFPQKIVKELLKDGTHKLELGFRGGKGFSEPLNVKFYSEASKLGYDFSVSILEEEKLEFSPASEMLLNVWDFCVTDDGLIIIPDKDAGRIYIYEKMGTLLKVIGEIGGKEDDTYNIVKPTFCFYDNTARKFAVLDLGKRKIILYKHIVEERKFVRDSIEINCTSAYEIQIRRNRLYIAGYKTDSNGNRYSFYSIDLDDERNKEFLLPSKDFYGFDNSAAFDQQLETKNISAIGITGSFDIRGDYAYVVWQGDLRVHCFDIFSDQDKSKIFGKQTRNYKNPNSNSTELVNAYHSRDEDLIRKAKQKVSLVTNVFTTQDSVLVFYEGPIKYNGNNIWVHFYSLDGKFKGESTIPGEPGWNKMFFDERNNNLYVLSQKAKKKKDGYILSKYHIRE